MRRQPTGSGRAVVRGRDGGASAVEYAIIIAGVVAALIVLSFAIRLTLERAYNAQLASIASGGRATISGSATPSPSPTLPAPTGLSGTPGDKTAALSWNAVTGTVFYNVYGCGVTPIKVTAPTTSYTCTGLTNGTKINVYVTANDGAGESGPSTTIQLTPAIPSAPVPTGLTAGAADKAVTLTWNASSGATGYVVYGCPTNLAGIAVTGTSYICQPLTNGTAYTFSVSATKTGAAESAKSGTVTATPVLPKPTAPTGVTATPGDKTISVSWAQVTGAASYTVTGCGASPIIITGNPPATTASCTAPAVANGTTYSIVVTASNTSGTSPNSATVQAIPAVPAPKGQTWTRAFTPTPGNLNYQNCQVTPNNTNGVNCSYTNGNLRLQVQNSAPSGSVVSVTWTFRRNGTTQTVTEFFRIG